MLSPSKYIQAIELTQLVSIDLLIFDISGNLLVGKRINEPAKGTYFVPGSRIYKNERLYDGIKRVSMTELGVILTRNDVEFIGVYEHIYPNSFCTEDINTHYVVNTYKYILKDDKEKNYMNKYMKIQHDDILWLSKEEILNREDVHEYTKMYFMDKPFSKSF